MAKKKTKAAIEDAPVRRVPPRAKGDVADLGSLVAAARKSQASGHQPLLPLEGVRIVASGTRAYAVATNGYVAAISDVAHTHFDGPHDSVIPKAVVPVGPSHKPKGVAEYDPKLGVWKRGDGMSCPPVDDENNRVAFPALGPIVPRVDVGTWLIANINWKNFGLLYEAIKVEDGLDGNFRLALRLRLDDEGRVEVTTVNVPDVGKVSACFQEHSPMIAVASGGVGISTAIPVAPYKPSADRIYDQRRERMTDEQIMKELDEQRRDNDVRIKAEIAKTFGRFVSVAEGYLAVERAIGCRDAEARHPKVAKDADYRADPATREREKLPDVHGLPDAAVDDPSDDSLPDDIDVPERPAAQPRRLSRRTVVRIPPRPVPR